MNILPLILALALMLTVLVVEKVEKFKNQAIIQKEYQAFLMTGERQFFNQRQEKLYGVYKKNIKQLSFRFFVDKDSRKKQGENIIKPYRILTIALMEILYQEADFYKNLKSKRSNFLEELLNAIETAADDLPKKLSRIEDIATLDLKDPELQQAFYHMLKGTVTRKKFLAMKTETPEMSDKIRGKTYVSLLNFINFNGAGGVPTIEIQKSPRELLKAIFEKDDVVESVIAKRTELAKAKDNGSSKAFESEFQGKIRTDIPFQILDFKISKGDKLGYN